MLGASDRPNNEGLDFLFLCNPFVKANAVDAEHMVRRALLGNNNGHTVVSITVQNGMDQGAMLSRYAAAGLSIGTIFGNAPPELGIPQQGYKCTCDDIWTDTSLAVHTTSHPLLSLGVTTRSLVPCSGPIVLGHARGWILSPDNTCWKFGSC